MNITIRKADASDIPGLIIMLADLFSIEDDFDIDLLKQETALEMIISGKTGGVILIAENNSDVIGMVNLQKVISTAAGGYSVLLEDLYVVPRFRNMGTGSLLVDYAVAWGKENNALRIQLAADARNINATVFYSGKGFARSNMIFYYKLI